MTMTNWNQLIEDHEIAFLKADVCIGSPQSYSLAEKIEICEGMEEATAKAEAAMREDFAAMPPTLQARMLDLLQQADPGNFEWWMRTLAGDTPDAPPEE